MSDYILLVDDNALQAATRQAILARTGARVLVAHRADEALRMLAGGSEILHSLRLVVTDHLMPGMNGPELVRRLREMLPRLPVLVLSGLTDAEAEYEQLGVFFHLKPFPPEELIQTVKQLLPKPALM